MRRMLQPTISRARRRMRDELPDLHREFERGRGRLPPLAKARVARRLVEGALELHDRKMRSVRLHRYGEAAKTDTNTGAGGVAFHSHILARTAPSGMHESPSQNCPGRTFLVR